MTHRVRAHFDGRALVLDEPADLPLDTPLDLTIEPARELQERSPILADPSRTREERLAAIRRTFSHGAPGANLPDEAMRREHMYGRES
jgi:hypothetical protein